MLLQIFFLLISIVALYFGAELTLEAAEKIGRFFKFSSLAIGLLLVGFGTSLPEFFVSHVASLRGEVLISLGNIIGSNMANLFLIMAMASLFTPLPLSGQDMKNQMLLHLLVTSILTGLLLILGVGLVTLLLSCCFFGLYLYLTIAQKASQKKIKGPPDLFKKEKACLRWRNVLKLLFGFILLYVGGEFLVASGTKLALMAGVSPYTISVIFVALGTSFPELVTALLASLKGKDQNLITGNIIGSNVFNLTFVMGSLGIYKIPPKGDVFLEAAILTLASILLLFLSQYKKNFTRFFGIFFLSIYISMLFYWH